LRPPSPPLLRVIYSSRSTAAPAQRPQQVNDILAQARSFNAAHGITGLLTVCKDEYLQLLDGPAEAVTSLLERIQRDSRHSDVDVLARCPADAPVFAHWSMALVERYEPDRRRANRLQALRARLAADPGVRPADFFRFMLAPGDSSRGDAPGARTADVVFCSPSGLWGPAVLARVINNSTVRTGRTVIAPPSAEPTERTLIEYADTIVPGYGPVRAIAMPGTVVGQPMLLPLIDRLALVVLLLAPSDMPGLGAHLRHWTMIAQQRGSQPDFLVVSSVAAERIERSLAALEPAAASVHVLSLKLSAAAAIWEAASNHLRDMLARQPRVPLPPSEPELPPPLSSPATEMPPEPEPTAAPEIEPDPMARLLQRLMSIDGTRYAAVVELGSPWRLIASAPDGDPWPDLDGTLEFLRLKQDVLHRLSSDDAAEELAITTSTHFVLMRPLAAGNDKQFALLTLDRNAAHLGAARMQMQQALLG
jgi:Sensors of blue-light using FAD